MPDRNNYNDREYNAIERDRMERRRQTRRKSMVTNILVIAVVVAVIAGIIIAVVALTSGKKNADTQSSPTVVTATIASDGQTKETSASAQQPTSANISGNNNAAQNGQQNSETTSSYNAIDPALNKPTEASGYSDNSSSSSPADGSNQGSASNNGKDLYYTAYGSTTEGWDYTYSYDPSHVVVTCSYDTANRQYNFDIAGVSEGTTTLTLYYNVDDSNQQAVTMTVYVDSDLNVTQVN